MLVVHQTFNKKEKEKKMSKVLRTEEQVHMFVMHLPLHLKIKLSCVHRCGERQ